MVSRHLGMAVLASGLLATQADAENFETRLSPSPLTDGTRINVTGQGSDLVQWDGNILSVSGNFAGLATGATTAEIYDGPGIGIPGPKAFDLSVTQDTSRRVRAFETATGRTLWQTSLPTSAQGHIVSYAVDGKQYIAIESGLGGGSPVGKPTTLLPDIHHPNNGNAIFVFALPDN